MSIKIWIRPSEYMSAFVAVSPNKNGSEYVFICRKSMEVLLQGTGKTLPFHRSHEVVEVTLTAN